MIELHENYHDFWYDIVLDTLILIRRTKHCEAFELGALSIQLVSHEQINRGVYGVIQSVLKRQLTDLKEKTDDPDDLLTT